MLKNLGISTSYFAAKGFSIYDSVKDAYDLGFRLIELGANHRHEDGLEWTISKIRQDFSDATFTQHCYFPPVFTKEYFANPAYGLNQENKKVLDRMFKAADILKPKIISFHNGFNNTYTYDGEFMEFKGFKKFKIVEGISQDKALLGLKAFIKYALEKGQERGIKIAVENVVSKTFGTKCTINGLSAFRDLLKEFPELNFLLDFGHAFIEYPNPFEFFSIGEKIIEIHLDDVTPQMRDHRVLGKGILNLEKMFGEIKKLPKMPILVLEHSAEVKENEILEEVNLVDSYLK